ncbi:MAG: hypothetical protein WBC92_12115 [Terracidiphilus sp.]
MSINTPKKRNSEEQIIPASHAARPIATGLFTVCVEYSGQVDPDVVKIILANEYG